MNKIIKNKANFSTLILILMILVVIVLNNTCGTKYSLGKFKLNTIDTIYANINGEGTLFEFSFQRGKEHNHPLMALWLEDEAGNYIQTLFVTQSVSTGIFKYGKHEKGKWVAAPRKRPAALPYWSHKSGIAFIDSAVIKANSAIIPDAYSGATPKGNYLLNVKSEKQLNSKSVKVFFEVNQPWDWNDYWHNAKFPDDEEYKTSCQPAIVYMATVDISKVGEEYVLLPLGHSHYNGSDGNLTADLSTLTTALEIVQKATIKILR